MSSPPRGRGRAAGVLGGLVLSAGLVTGLAAGATLDAGAAHHRTIHGPAPTRVVPPVAAVAVDGAAVAVGW